MAIQVVLLSIFSGVVSALAAVFDLFPTWAKVTLTGLFIWVVGNLNLEVAGTNYTFHLIDDLIVFIFSPLGVGINSAKIGIGLFCGGIIILLWNITKR